jgi:hypothetical protein
VEDQLVLDPIDNFEDFDVLVRDVNDELLRSDISKLLGHPYLGKVGTNEKSRCYVGQLYGVNFRAFLSLPVQFDEQLDASWIHFLVDTGSPITCVSQQVFPICLYLIFANHLLGVGRVASLEPQRRCALSQYFRFWFVCLDFETPLLRHQPSWYRFFGTARLQLGISLRC